MSDCFRGCQLTLVALAIAMPMLALTAQGRRAVDTTVLTKPSDADWVTYGRDYAETHHSPLKQIDVSNVSRLGVAWSTEVGSQGKVETTPLVWNGVLYGTSTWSVVFAIDVRTGKLRCCLELRRQLPTNWTASSTSLSSRGVRAGACSRSRSTRSRPWRRGRRNSFLS